MKIDKSIIRQQYLKGVPVGAYHSQVFYHLCRLEDYVLTLAAYSCKSLHDRTKETIDNNLPYYIAVASEEVALLLDKDSSLFGPLEHNLWKQACLIIQIMLDKPKLTLSLFSILDAFYFAVLFLRIARDEDSSNSSFYDTSYVDSHCRKMLLEGTPILYENNSNDNIKILVEYLDAKLRAI